MAHVVLHYCAGCNKATKHTVVVDRNSEFVATCNCGRFLKFPASFKFVPTFAAPPLESNPSPEQSNAVSAKVPFWRSLLRRF
jgi:hypothetical protein